MLCRLCNKKVAIDGLEAHSKICFEREEQPPSQPANGTKKTQKKSEDTIKKLTAQEGSQLQIGVENPLIDGGAISKKHTFTITSKTTLKMYEKKNMETKRSYDDFQVILSYMYITSS